MKNLAVAIVAATVLCSGAARAETLEYTFASPADAADFTPIPTSLEWAVAGAAFGPGPAKNKFAAVIVDTKFKQVSARATVENLTPNAMAGLVVRASRKGPNLSGYVGTIQDTGKVTVARIIRFNQYDIKKMSGSFDNLCTKDIKIVDAKNVEFRAKGESLKLFYNGKLVCSAKDDEYANGKVGLFGTAAKTQRISFSSASFED